MSFFLYTDFHRKKKKQFFQHFTSAPWPSDEIAPFVFDLRHSRLIVKGVAKGIAGGIAKSIARGHSKEHSKGHSRGHT